MKKQSVLALVTVTLLCGCQQADNKRLSSHYAASETPSAVRAIEVPLHSPDSVPQGEARLTRVPTESPRVETEEEKHFVERPLCTTTFHLVSTERAAAVPLIIATLDRLSGETNASTRCQIIQGALWSAEVCTNAQFHAIIQRGRNDLSESVRLKTSLMVSNALIRLQLTSPQAK